VPLYEHGFVGLLDTMGDDHDIASAARISYGAGTKSVSDDRNLLRYLVRHKHTSPLEMAEVKFHLKLPIVVMRQLVRHRTANLNEASGRYSEMSDEFYIPTDDYLAPQSTTNKQGRAGSFSAEIRTEIRSLIQSIVDIAYGGYKMLLGDAPSRLKDLDEEYPGLSRELSRIVLPVSNYTECYWKCDLHNFFNFCRLRMDSHAQQEIRDFATAMYNLAKPYFPLAAEAFEDYIFNSITLSRMDIAALKDMLQNKFDPNSNTYGMSKREMTEFIGFWSNPQNDVAA
jgi:thymidylate synthase (FAD)